MYKLSALYLCLILIVFGCANQKPPTGGEKDEEPPKLVQSTPKHQQLNFKGKEIELTFNEAIKLNNAKEQIIITPRVSSEYEIKFRKDKVIISLEEALEDSTTYTFNFREGIQDLNEGNPAQNLKIAFSTGPHLDSLQISGSVKDILLNKAAKDLTVSLYPTYDTLNPLEHPPIYFTKTDNNGNFSFENLKANKYSIIALVDKNKNLYIDSKSESYGFLIDTLDLQQNIDSLIIPIQHLDLRPIELKGARQSGTVFQIKYNKYILNYLIENNQNIELRSNFTDKSQNTIQVFRNESITDSLESFVTVQDSLRNPIQDTIYIKFEDTNRSPRDLTSSLNLQPVIAEIGKIKAEIAFSKPISTINYDSAYIYIDSLHVFNLDTTNITLNQRRDSVFINYSLDQSLFQQPTDTTSTAQKTEPKQAPTKEVKSDSTNTKKETKQENVKPYIRFAKYSFISVEGDSSKQIKKNLTFEKLADNATLLVEVQPSNNQNFIVQLLDKGNLVVRERYNEQQFKFDELKPGEYRIRVLIDINKNGRWDPGNFYEKQEPEPVVFFTNSEGQENITLRANWEVGPNIITF